MLLCLPILCIMTSSLSLKCDISTGFTYELPRNSFIRSPIPCRELYTSTYLTKEGVKNVRKLYSIANGFNSVTDIFSSKGKSNLLWKVPTLKTAGSLNKYFIASKAVRTVLYTTFVWLISEVNSLVDYIKLLYLKASNFPLSNLFNLCDSPIPVLIELNFVVFVVDFLFKGRISRLFKLDGSAVFSRGELYRMMTSLFIHSSIVHLVINMVSLNSIGSNSMRMFGPKRLLAIYLISGIVGNYVSYLCNYAHKNGIPANLVHILTKTATKLGVYKRSMVGAAGPAVNDILKTERDKCLIRFLIDHVTTSIEMALHYFTSEIIALLGVILPPKMPRELEDNFKGLCRGKFGKSFTACGASSAIYGLRGAIVAHNIRYGYRKKLEGVYDVLLPLILPNIVNAFNDNIDHYSHTAGFIVGAILAIIMD